MKRSTWLAAALTATLALTACSGPAAEEKPAGTDQAETPEVGGSDDDVEGTFLAGEEFVAIPSQGHDVPGTLNAQKSNTPQPVVLMLHGTASARDEVGNLYVDLAEALHEQGIASLRIDFAGSGASKQAETDLNYPGMVSDAQAALEFLQADARFDNDRIGVIGFSRGSTVAASLVGANSDIAAFASWSGAIRNGESEDPQNAAIAATEGHVVVDLGFRTWDYSSEWFTSNAEHTALDDALGYEGAFLGIVGTDDDVVDPSVSKGFSEKVASSHSEYVEIDGGDHIFRVLDGNTEMTGELIKVTNDWFVRVLK